MLNKISKLYMLLCEINAFKQKTVHSSITYYLHVILYNATHICLCINASQSKDKYQF
jgi:predicted metalloenzyme YecM